MPPPSSVPSSRPLGGDAGDDWDDDDEKTTVFDRSHEESAQALLQKAPSTSSTPAHPSAHAPFPAAPNPMTATVPSSPLAAKALSALGAPSTGPSQPHVPAGSNAVSAGPMPSQPAASAPMQSAPMQLPYPEEPVDSKKKNLYLGLGTLAALLVGGFLVFGGSSPGGLLVTVAGPGGTAVPGVKVLVDGQVKCEDSPCKIDDLEAGSYVVKAVASGYAEMAGQAHQIVAGEQKAVNVTLLSGAATGIEVSAEAPGLSLIVDGKKIGALPQEVTELEPGEHKIEVSGSEFFEEYKKTITVKPGEMAAVEPELKLKKGQVTVKLDNSAEDSKVYLLVDGKRRPLNRIVEKGSPLILPVDGKSYQIIATKKGYKDFEENLSFSNSEPVKTVTVSMEEEGEKEEAPSSSRTTNRTVSTRSTSSTSSSRPSSPAPSGKGTLNINSIPVSNVILDGRPLGTTPKIGIKVSAGKHTVLFVHKTKGRKSSTVTVRPGKTATAAVRF